MGGTAGVGSATFVATTIGSGYFSLPIADAYFTSINGNLIRNTGNNSVTISKTGTYDIDFGCIQNNWLNTNQLTIRVNGVTRNFEANTVQDLTGYRRVKAILNLNTGDAIEIALLTIDAARNPTLTIKQLGSTATTSTTRVAVSAGNAAGQTFAGSAIVTGWTTVTDPTNSFNSATGIFTAPRSGNYMVTANMLWGNNTWATGNAQFLTINKNGVTVAQDIWSAWTAITSQFPSTKAMLVQLSAGDTIDIRMSSTKAGGGILNPVVTSNQLSIVEFTNNY